MTDYPVQRLARAIRRIADSIDNLAGAVDVATMTCGRLPADVGESIDGLAERVAAATASAAGVKDERCRCRAARQKGEFHEP